MLVDLTPTSFEDDIATTPEIKTHEQILKYCRDQAKYDCRVSCLASARIKNHRSGGKINSLVDEYAPPPRRHPETRLDRSLDDEAPAWAEGMIRAVTKSKGGSRPITEPEGTFKLETAISEARRPWP